MSTGNILAAAITGVAVGAVAAYTAAHGLTYPPRRRNDGPVKSEFLEYSVIYTDRAVNLMAPSFSKKMRSISSALKSAYNADETVIIPGSGTYGMEAVAMCYGKGKKCLVIRNGYFSYRWSDIMTVSKIPSEPETILLARPKDAAEAMPQLLPCPASEVCARIRSEKPAVVFMPHVETSTGMLMSDEYILEVANATHDVGGIFVLDAIAAGTVWCDMKATNVDIVISAPQKGWTGPACCGLVMMNNNAVAKMKDNADHLSKESVSFCCNLQQWHNVMQAYEDGGFKYYTTLPTDALLDFAAVIEDAQAFGLDRAKDKMFELGNKVRKELAQRGFKSVAAPEVAAPGVVVVYSPISGMVGKLKGVGIQVAGGVPWKLGEENYVKGDPNPKTNCFRIGLFGLDKIKDVDTTVSKFFKGLDQVIQSESKL